MNQQTKFRHVKIRQAMAAGHEVRVPRVRGRQICAVLGVAAQGRTTVKKICG